MTASKTNLIKKIFNIFFNPESGSFHVKIMAMLSFILGVIVICIYANTKGDLCPKWLSTCLIIAFANFGIGGVVGLLFAMPKALHQKGQEQYIKINTNFEEIADWITKIIIGLGLTQIIQLPSFLVKIATKIVSGITNNCNPDCLFCDVPFIIFLIIFYLIIGFVLVYFYAKFDYLKHIGKGLFVNYEVHSASEEDLRNERLENSKLKETARNIFNENQLTDSEKQILKKILSVFQKEILKQMIEDKDKIYRIQKGKILKMEEYLDLNHLITIHVAKFVDGDTIYNSNAIELEKKFRNIELNDII